MRILRHSFSAFLLLGLLGLAGPLQAQQGTLTGRVIDIETGQPLSGAQISILGGGQGLGGLSNDAGSYRIELPAGSYRVVVEFLGYVTASFDNVEVTAGGSTAFDVQLSSNVLALSPLVVTASRGRAEKLVETPATTHLVSSMQIQERPTQTPVDHLRQAPGVDIITEGISSSNIVVRGFNNIFSGALHALTDHRLAGVPSLRVNLLHFIPSNDDDIDRMEVVLGPGSALYGPNTANGVLHIFTKSPLDSASQGTTVTLGGGERSVLQGSFRTSHLINRRLGVKFSGQYIKGDEWEYTDLGEAAARSAADASPAVCQGKLTIRGYGSEAATDACSRVGVRDFDMERYGLEARADYRFAEDGTAVFTYGRTSGTGIELTGLGAAQIEDWVYEFYQARVSKGRFFAQAYHNASDAGGTWLLRDGVPLVDKSTLSVAQLQHGFSLFDERQDLTYGIDIFRTRPDTEGTINGVYDDEDDINEWGAYLQSKTALSPKFDLIFAGRVDDHSLLPERVWSPRAALVFKPSENQSLRATYNRAFSTPSSLNLFLDLSAGLAPNEQLAALGYTVRAFGTGPNGYSFQNADGSLKGMRSPFAPGFMPADPAIMWQLAMGVLQAQVASGGLPASLAGLLPVLGALSPSSSDIGVMLLNTSSGALTPLETTTIPATPGITESYTETFEVGWQGILAQKLRISADVYFTKKKDFTSPLLIQNPLLLLNGQDVGAFITAPIVGAITEQLMGMGLDYDAALAEAMNQAAAIVPQLATAIGGLPVGVAATPEIASQQADIIVSYRNVGDIDFWGADVAFSWFLDDKFTLTGSYSHVSNDWFRVLGQAPLALNAPKDKGSLGLAFRNPKTGFNGEAVLRVAAEFPAESAGYVGTRCIQGHEGGLFEEDCIESTALVDVNFGYKIPNTAATLQVVVTNIFDTPYRSFVGVPDIGRFAMVRMKYDLW